ncbi:MAG: ABC transporter permease [Oscillospiraceae bacterium]
MNSKTKEKALSVIMPVAFGLLLLLLLQTQVIHRIFSLKTMQLPLPSTIFEALCTKAPKIISDAGVTLSAVSAGLLLGSFIGFLVASFATMLPGVGYGSLTIMTALNSIPVLALAPLMNRWFSTSMGAKMAVVTVVCMGAMAANAYRGLNNLKPFSLDLMKSYAANRRQIFFKLRLPNCVPYLFTGLKINVATAMIGAIISEFFATETSGIGYMIKNSLKVGNQKILGWAYIITAAIISMLIYALILFLERLAARRY